MQDKTLSKLSTVKYDIIIIIITVFIAVFMYFIRNSSNGDGTAILIYLDNELYGEYSLTEDCLIEIQSDDSVINTIKICDGYAYMESASCPDGLCTRQQRIKNNGESICCLPNKVYVEVKADGVREYDAFAQ